MKKFKVVYDEMCNGTLKAESLESLASKLILEVQEMYNHTGLTASIVIDSDYYIRVNDEGVIEHGYLLNI